MKFRFMLGVLAIVAGLVVGFGTMTGQAHAATAVTLSDAERSNMQAALNLTRMTLDAIQVQADRNMIKDKTATLAILANIRTSLLSMRETLGGVPASATPAAAKPSTVVATVKPAAPVVAASPGQVAGSAAVNETVGASATSKRVFWIILIAAIVIAIILAIPRKKNDVVTFQSAAPEPAPQEPEPQSEETEPAQSV